MAGVTCVTVGAGMAGAQEPSAIAVGPASRQDLTVPLLAVDGRSTPTGALADVGIVPRLEDPAGGPALAVRALAPRENPRRPAPLVPLYMGFAALQAGDVVSTFRALDRGASEANPVMGGLVQHRAAFVALKAGMTAGTLLMSERLWKKNRVAAVAMLVALNGAYAAVVAHNARVVSSLPTR